MAEVAAAAAVVDPTAVDREDPVDLLLPLPLLSGKAYYGRPTTGTDLLTPAACRNYAQTLAESD